MTTTERTYHQLTSELNRTIRLLASARSIRKQEVYEDAIGRLREQRRRYGMVLEVDTVMTPDTEWTKERIN